MMKRRMRGRGRARPWSAGDELGSLGGRADSKVEVCGRHRGVVVAVVRVVVVAWEPAPRVVSSVEKVPRWAGR